MSDERLTFALVETGDTLRRVWPFVRDYLAAALEFSVQNEWTADQVFERIERGQYLLAIVLRGGAVIGAQVFEHGTDAHGKRYVASVCTGGVDLEEWLGGMVAICKRLAELAHADRVVIMGRRGWGLALRAYGLEVRTIIGTADVDKIVTPVEFAELVGGL